MSKPANVRLRQVAATGRKAHPRNKANSEEPVTARTGRELREYYNDLESMIAEVERYVGQVTNVLANCRRYLEQVQATNAEVMHGLQSQRTDDNRARLQPHPGRGKRGALRSKRKFAR